MEKTIYQSLLKVQKELGAIKKDSTNPFFKSKYFDINSLLEHVKPIVNRHGLVIVQSLSAIGDKPALNTQIIDADTGYGVGSTIPLPEVADPQKAGSAITYYRRYALQSLLALEVEDDDAETAVRGKTIKSNTSSEVPF